MPMRKEGPFSDESFVLVKLKVSLGKWLPKLLTVEECQMSNDKLISEVKKVTPNHSLVDPMLNRVYYQVYEEDTQTKVLNRHVPFKMLVSYSLYK